MRSLLIISLIITGICFQAAVATNQSNSDCQKMSEQCYSTCVNNMCSKLPDRQEKLCYFEVVYVKNSILDNCFNLTYDGCLKYYSNTFTKSQTECISCWLKCRKSKTQKL